MIYQALEHLVVGFPLSLSKASMLKADRAAGPVAKKHPKPLYASSQSAWHGENKSPVLRRVKAW